MDENPIDEQIRQLLASNARLAVVGLSPKPHRDSHQVSAYMQQQGYAITPVYPREDEILGEPCMRSLTEAAARGPLEIVNVFRRSEDVPPIVDEAIASGAAAIWMQLGVAHREAAERARDAGLMVVQNRCIKIEHQRLMPGPSTSDENSPG